MGKLNQEITQEKKIEFKKEFMDTVGLKIGDSVTFIPSDDPRTFFFEFKKKNEKNFIKSDYSVTIPDKIWNDLNIQIGSSYIMDAMTGVVRFLQPFNEIYNEILSIYGDQQ